MTDDVPDDPTGPPTGGEAPGSGHDDVFDAIAARMREELAADASGHDMDHAWRVFALGRRIARAEGADPLVVGAAALVHDLHRVMGDDGYVAPRASLPRVEAVLRAAGFPGERIDEVLQCVAVHEHYDFEYTEGETDPNPAETTEAEVLQDADNLDAIGAVGVARAFAFAGARGNRFWTEHPVPERGCGRDDGGDTVAHFRAKLLHVADHLNTETAREIARDRHAFIERFLDRFEREWHGEA